MTAIIMAAPMNSLPHYRGCLTIVLLLCALTGNVRAAEPECPPAPSSDVVPAAGEAPGTIHWSGCRMTVAANGDTELTGDVAVSVDGKEMHCDHLSYLASTQELKMSGTVRLEDATVRIIGDTGDYSNSGAQLTHAQFELLQHPGRGEAEAISTVQPNVYELKNVSYTTCPQGRRGLVAAGAQHYPRHQHAARSGPSHRGGLQGRTDTLPAVDILSVEQCAPVRVPVSHARQLFAERCHILHTLVLEHCPEPGPDRHADRLHAAASIWVLNTACSSRADRARCESIICQMTSSRT